MDENDRIKKEWRDKGFDKFMSRPVSDTPKPADFMGGADFDAMLDELLFNRMIRLKDLREKPQGNDPGKLYWDGANKKYKIWIDSVGKWADVVWTSTSTSTSTTSSSSSSSSTSSTSTSTS